MGKHTLCRNPSAPGGSWYESTSVIMYICTIFLDAHCQKQWASLGVIFSGKKEEGIENEKSWEILKGQWGLPKAMGISRSDIFRETRTQSVP